MTRTALLLVVGAGVAAVECIAREAAVADATIVEVRPRVETVHAEQAARTAGNHPLVNVLTVVSEGVLGQTSVAEGIQTAAVGTESVGGHDLNL
mmetsp:Transcript_60350/g.168616  ORF Transcript_60350/g.168616 Transcript_60350/m.168616 type:complete len:94 (+) Transcript_60350:339-620(+)